MLGLEQHCGQDPPGYEQIHSLSASEAENGSRLMIQMRHLET